MKAATTKKLLFGVLLLIFVYIWWGNLRLFFSSDEPTYDVADALPQTANIRASKTSLTYHPYHVNPFVPTFGQPQTPSSKPPVEKPDAIEKISATCQLIGIVPQGKVSQAVIKQPDGRSVILAIGDSLHTWQLTAVLKEAIVFKHGKLSDTLILAKKQ